MKSSDPLLLADGNLRCRMYPAGQVAISWHLVIPGFHQRHQWPYCWHSRPPDLKSSSNVSLPFAWITGPATDPSFMWCVRHYFVTTVVQAFDFWLTCKTPVWAKSLKSEQLKLHKCVNNKKSACFIIQKLSRNFKCPKMAHRQAKISNSKYSYWIRGSAS